MSESNLRANYLLESLHRAGYTVRAENGKLIVEHPEHDIGEALQRDIDRHQDALLKMLKAAEDLERIRNAGTKGSS